MGLGGRAPVRDWDGVSWTIAWDRIGSRDAELAGGRCSRPGTV